MNDVGLVSDTVAIAAIISGTVVILGTLFLIGYLCRLWYRPSAVFDPSMWSKNKLPYWKKWKPKDKPPNDRTIIG